VFTRMLSIRDTVQYPYACHTVHLPGSQSADVYMSMDEMENCLDGPMFLSQNIYINYCSGRTVERTDHENHSTYAGYRPERPRNLIVELRHLICQLHCDPKSKDAINYE
jgi:hypothetical protein